MNSLYKKIDEATQAENNRELWFWYGRFTIIFIDFEPLVEEAIDDSDFGFDDEFISTDVPMINLMSEAEQEFELLSRPNLRSSKVNSRKLSPHVQGFFGSSFAFVNGFVNASFGDASPNAKICETNITRIISYGLSFRNQVKNASEESLALAAYSAENVLAAVHPITYSCYHSVGEFGETGNYYMDTFNDFSKISFNLIHKLGNIYDTVYFLTKHQSKFDSIGDMTEGEVSNWWFKLGIYYGTTVFLVLYTPDDFQPYDPLDEYTGLSDGDHLEDK